MIKPFFRCSAQLAVVAALAGSPTLTLAQESDIHVGGAVRFQYSYEGFDDGNKSRGGDIDLDTFRLNFDGSLSDIILSAEWRYYDFMQVIHHAWVGYDFTDTLGGEAGITQVPFGNLPFNSHGFFFSSNYYLGLEDDYDAGIKLSWLAEPWDVRVAFFKNDERGGVGSGLDRYSFDVVAADLSDVNNSAIGETNTLAGRAAYTFGAGTGAATQIGLSALGGRLHDGTHYVGSYRAFAPHLNGNYGRWNVQLQVTKYEYDLDSGADQLVLGAFSAAYGIPADAVTYTANLAYRLPVSWGPISALNFYSDNSLVTDKSDGTADTIMNILGVFMEAGPVLAYLDFVSAKNQPFIGGTMIGDSDDREQRVNLNIGYYF
jgi:hypothetical protein